MVASTSRRLCRSGPWQALPWTGGLSAALWAHAVRDDPAHGPDLLVLDSPFFSLSGSRLADAGVDRWVRSLEGASDHAPAWIEL